MIDLKHVLSELTPRILETGNFIAGAAKSFSLEQVEFKGFNDLVSYVDKEAEKKLVSACREILPEAGFITEEGTATGRAEEYNWIIDPLDGTTNFVHGLPVYSVSVGLACRGKMVLGVVYEINREELFSAIRGNGAFCNGEPISVNKTTSLGNTLLATGFPYYNFNQMSVYLKILDHFMQHTHGLRRLGSAAVDLAYVACGRFDGFFEYNLNAWDVAAGILLVQEAGGTVSDFRNGEDYLFGREIIAAGGVHPEMQKVIGSLWERE